MASLAGAEEIIDFANAYTICDGSPLSESQEIVLRTAMGERANGRWAASTVCHFGPRQGAGKSDTIAARELHGLFVVGERLQIHTAHEFPTANQSFLRLVDVLDAWDDLRRKVQRVRYANGEQGIEMRMAPGRPIQRLTYKARTGGSGRGYSKADLVVYDEAQHVQAAHISASAPTRMARPNSQGWYAGSGGLSSSMKAWEFRRRALRGDAPRLAYIEHTAERVELNAAGRLISDRPPTPDALRAFIDDRSNWECIPGLGNWIEEETVEGLLDELGPEGFVREVLCVWAPDETTEEGVLIPNWADLADRESRIVSHHCLALDVSPDRRFASFGAAGRRADGDLHVEAVECRPSTDWVFGVAEASWNLRHLPFRIQSGSPAASFIAPFREAGIDVVEVSPAEHAQAVGQFLDAAAARTLHHPASETAPEGSVLLAAAVRGAELRSSGDVDLWARRSPKGNITPLVAVTLALGGVPAHAMSTYEDRGLEVFG